MTTGSIAARWAGIHTTAVATRRVPIAVIAVTAAIAPSHHVVSGGGQALHREQADGLADSTGWYNIADLYCTAGEMASPRS